MQDQEVSKSSMKNPSIDINSWLNFVRDFIKLNHSEFLSMFEVYAGEARYGRDCIEKNLSSLSRGATILEVGAGVMLLSCQLVREGFKVTALEPTSVGFSRFSDLRKIVLSCARELSCEPQVLEKTAETLDHSEKYQFAFSINVMEHVENVEISLDRVIKSLAPRATYRFICPNYLFPYETHFNIPIIGSKSLTYKFFQNKIKAAFPDNPIGVWNSLNWINTWQLKKYFKKTTGIHWNLGTDLFAGALERVVNDEQFSLRRTGAVIFLVKLFLFFGFHKLTKFLPAGVHPLIDCTIEKQ